MVIICAKYPFYEILFYQNDIMGRNFVNRSIDNSEGSIENILFNSLDRELFPFIMNSFNSFCINNSQISIPLIISLFWDHFKCSMRIPIIGGRMIAII